LDLAGIAAGAVVTDPGEILRTLDGGPWSALGVAGLLGLSHAHRHLPLRHILTGQARRVLAEAQTASVATLCQRYGQPLGSWCDRPDPWDDPLWRQILTHELISASVVPDVPVHLYHGGGDTIVPVEFGHRLYTGYRAHGAAASWHEYGADHFRTALDATGDVLDRLADDLIHARPV
jgi:fermentation-respiration switch protein FrsA (DUF1100 family)